MMKMTTMKLGIRMRMLNQFIGLYIREVKNTYKNPAIIVVSIVQPLLWIVFFGSSFSAAPRLFLESFFHTDNYIAFLLSGQLSTSMLFVGMFSSLSLIQDKKSGYLRRIMVTPTRNYIIFLAKVLGASTRGMLQVPIVFLGVMLLGVTIPGVFGISCICNCIIFTKFRTFIDLSFNNNEKFRLANSNCYSKLYQSSLDVFKYCFISKRKLSSLDADYI